MGGQASARAPAPPGWVSIVMDDASADHAHVVALGRPAGAQGARNAADALHHLCTVHGRHPGVVDHAAAGLAGDEPGAAMRALADAFAAERDYLAHLVVAAGSRPSTPGQAESMASVVAQRHAIDMLAQSERGGVAAGAALALALDWRAIRLVLDAAAARFGVEVAPCRLPAAEVLVALGEGLCASPATARAFCFGAQQIAAQHRGLWDLLAARAKARASI